MPSNQENIEAKLAAYVDGELSGADREEIERHLTANPQHRKLMKELMQTSAMLKDLPRAGAPADVLESLQSQLERSALLGRPEELDGEGSYKIGFWTQFRAVAAILLLTAGLAMVVYFVLPRSAPNIELADKDTPPIIVEEQVKPLPPSVPERTEVATARSAPAPAGIAGDAMKREATAEIGAERFTLEPKSLANDPVSPEIRQTLANSGVRDDATIIFVDTSNAPLANATVSNYLNYNRATWEQMPVAMTSDVTNLIPSPAEALTTPRGVLENLQRQSVAQSKAGGAGSQVDTNLAANSVDQATASQQIGGSQMDLTQRQTVVQQAGAQPGNLIVARNLNRQQIAELSGLLNQESVGAVSNFTRGKSDIATGAMPATVLPPPNLTGPATTQSARRLKAGDAVMIVVSDSNVGEATIQIYVEADGGMKFNDLGDLPANGMSLEELNELLDARHRDAKLPGKPPAAVEILSRDNEGAKAESPAVGITPGGPAGVAATGTDESPTDVVIVVRQSTAAITQPKPVAAEPPSVPISSGPAPVDAERAAPVPPATTQASPTTQP